MSIFNSANIDQTYSAVFTDEKISHYDLQRILETTAWAPSPFNTQPWEFLVIQKDDFIRKFACAAAGWLEDFASYPGRAQKEDFLQKLPNLLICLRDTARRDPGPNEYRLSLLSMGTALANLMLAASAANIALQPLYPASPDSLQELKIYWHIPAQVEIACLFGWGYVKKAAAANRERPNIIIHDNQYNRLYRIEKLNPHPINPNPFNLIKSRHSYRKDFLREDLSAPDEDLLLETALNSFGFQNRRGRELIFIKDQGLINSLGDLMTDVSYEIHMDKAYEARMQTWLRYSFAETTIKADGLLLTLLNRFQGYVFKQGSICLGKYAFLKPVKSLFMKKVSRDFFGDLLRRSPLLVALVYKRQNGANVLLQELDIISLGILLQNLLLAASARNIGAQFFSILLDTKQGIEGVNSLLKLPGETEVINLLRLGYKNPRAPEKILSLSGTVRRPFEKIVHLEAF
ncbi:MAG: nitroreductase family protein [Candidatus Schekmanbacteria bacterium]|nr:nitroreductase family protein [Candidatus Schekmanbacteria bacterium]